MIDRVRFPIDPWRLVETRPDPASPGVAETLFSVGNGYLGLRGNHPDGLGATEHGTFVNGFHETWPIHHAEDAYGFAKVGQTIVNVPDPKVMRVYVDDEPMSLDLADVRDYERSLDFRDAVVRQRMRWITASGKEVLIESERMVSFEQRHLALLRMRVTVLNADAPVVINCQMINRQDGEDVYGGRAGGDTGTVVADPRRAEKIRADRVLVPQEYWQTELRSTLSYRTASSGMTLAIVADHLVDTDNAWVHRELIEQDIAKNVFRIDARAGVPVTITKVVAVHTSRVVPCAELIDRCRRTVDRAMAAGFEEILAGQKRFVADFWERSDVTVPGQDDVQQATRWSLLQLAMASARADGLGVPAKGLTGSGYSGHYFWDTEIYVLPFLTYTSPLWARNALRLRTKMLPAARRRAAQLSEGGALFPWRTINGEEASAYYAAGTAQYHINADIAYALMRYVHAAGDIDFLRDEGAELLVETARMWMTLGFWRRGDTVDSFHFHGVTGPDEYTAVVNDNLYTNVMARFNLRAAGEALAELAHADAGAYWELCGRLGVDATEIASWRRTAEAISIPLDEGLGIHPQDAQFLEHEVWDLAHTPAEKRPLLLHFHPLVIYRFQVLKQTDVVLALFLQSDQFTDAEKKADFDYYDPLTTGDSTLSAVVQSILAAEVGYQDLAMDYFDHALHVDLGDLHGNTRDGVHIASAGGVWSALVCGFGGMRDHGGELHFDPRLPEKWTELAFPLEWRGSRLRVTVAREAIRFAVLSGDPVTLSVRGEWVTVESDAERVVPLAHHGERHEGRPAPGHHASLRRGDGTSLEPVLPTVTGSNEVIADAGARRRGPDAAGA